MPDWAALRVMAEDVQEWLATAARVAKPVLVLLVLGLGFSVTTYLVTSPESFDSHVQHVILSGVFGGGFVVVVLVLYEILIDWYEDAKQRAHDDTPEGVVRHD